MTSPHIERTPRARRSFVAIAVAVVALAAAGCTPSHPPRYPRPRPRLPPHRSPARSRSWARATSPPSRSSTTSAPSSRSTRTARRRAPAACGSPRSRRSRWPSSTSTRETSSGFAATSRSASRSSRPAGSAGPARPGPSPRAPPTTARWPGYVLALDHNYSGMGAFNGSTVYMRKPTPDAGSAGPAPAPAELRRQHVDREQPRRPLRGPDRLRPEPFASFPYKGQAPTWVQLNGKWAVPGTTYAQTFLNICNNMRVHAGLAPVSTSATSSSLSIADAADDPIYADETAAAPGRHRAELSRPQRSARSGPRGT